MVKEATTKEVVDAGSTFGVTTDRCVVPSPSSDFPLLKR